MRLKADRWKVDAIRREGAERLASTTPELEGPLTLVSLDPPDLKRIFDAACEEIHYAGACHRVGRLARLAIVGDGQWLGGVVLGSPFPNIRPRDDAFGLTPLVTDWSQRGLISPWASENRQYWDRLQLIVNHARTFVFPDFQGGSVGIKAHRLLLTVGRSIWEDR